MRRFVILEHNHPERHWDFMLEMGDVLWTWRLERPPEPPVGPIGAARIGDHRVFYLDYEGPVSGGRGSVTRWDAGQFTLLHAAEDRVEVRLEGKRVRTNVLLAQVQGDKWTCERAPEC